MFWSHETVLDNEHGESSAKVSLLLKPRIYIKANTQNPLRIGRRYFYDGSKRGKIYDTLFYKQILSSRSKIPGCGLCLGSNDNYSIEWQRYPEYDECNQSRHTERMF